MLKIGIRSKDWGSYWWLVVRQGTKDTIEGISLIVEMHPMEL